MIGSAIFLDECVQKEFGNNLLDITTEKKGNYSCVTLRGIVLNGEEIEGPGKSAEALFVDKDMGGLDIENNYLFITDNRDPDYNPDKVQGHLEWNLKPKNYVGYYTY